MRTHRFGQKIKLPSTMAIKHQVRTLMAQDEIATAEAEAGAGALRGERSGEQEPFAK